MKRREDLTFEEAQALHRSGQMETADFLAWCGEKGLDPATGRKRLPEAQP